MMKSRLTLNGRNNLKPLTKNQLKRKGIVPDKVAKKIRKQYDLWSKSDNPPLNKQETLSKKFGCGIGTINKILRRQGAYK